MVTQCSSNDETRRSCPSKESRNCWRLKEVNISRFMFFFWCFCRAAAKEIWLPYFIRDNFLQETSTFSLSLFLSVTRTHCLALLSSFSQFLTLLKAPLINCSLSLSISVLHTHTYAHAHAWPLTRTHTSSHFPHSFPLAFDIFRRENSDLFTFLVKTSFFSISSSGWSSESSVYLFLEKPICCIKLDLGCCWFKRCRSRRSGILNFVCFWARASYLTNFFPKQPSFIVPQPEGQGREH